MVALYELQPEFGYYNFISPSAILSGEVMMQDSIKIEDNVVIRGDINVVRIGTQVSIGANSVLRTVASLPTGSPAILEIAQNTVIEPGCTQVSCEIGAKVWVGAKSVILEGAKLNDECMIGPNSVVPAGRLIPSGQLWAGNPVRYIRNLTAAEKYHIKAVSEHNSDHAQKLAHEYSQYKTGYLFKSNTQEDVNISDKDQKSMNEGELNPAYFRNDKDHV